MADRKEQGRGRPGEMEDAAISPVIGDIERRTTPPGEGDAFLQSLRGLRYPLARDDLEREAAGRGAPGELLDLLTRLPNRVYRSAEDVAGELERTPAWRPGPMR